jgi:NADH-quinone oxidoreductase subunit N
MIDVTGFFACLVALSRQGRPIERLEDFAGLSKESPGLALALTGLSFSVMGIPPFSGFWGKFYIFKAALAAGLWPVAVFGLVGSVVAAYYYLRLIKTIWFDPSPGAVDPAPVDARWIGMGAALFAFPLVVFALNPLDQAAHAAARAFGLG